MAQVQFSHKVDKQLKNKNKTKLVIKFRELL